MSAFSDPSNTALPTYLQMSVQSEPRQSTDIRPSELLMLQCQTESRQRMESRQAAVLPASMQPAPPEPHLARCETPEFFRNRRLPAITTADAQLIMQSLTSESPVWSGSIVPTSAPAAARTSSSSTQQPEDQFVVLFVSARDVPKNDLLSQSDPYIMACICSSDLVNQTLRVPPTTLTTVSTSDSSLPSSLGSNATTASGPNSLSSSSSPAFHISTCSSEPSPLVLVPTPSPKDGGHLSRRSKKRFANSRWAELETIVALRKGELVRSEKRSNCKDPVWLCSRDFSCRPDPINDVLVVLLFDAEKTKRDALLCYSIIPVSRLIASTDVHDIPMTRLVPASRLYSTTTALSLRWLPSDPPFASRKTIFLIRHGESVWNEAQRRKRAGKMVKTTDHPLNSTGIDQAERFNQQWTSIREQGHGVASTRQRQFFAADRVYCSPLTRAIQTAWVSLAHHFALARRPNLILNPEIREIKNFGGLDTIGKAVGPAIPARVATQFQKVVSRTRQVNFHLDDLQYIDVSRCASQWWTHMGHVDKTSALRRRFLDFASTIQFDRQCNTSAIVVGHSLFFKEFVSSYLAPELIEAKPELCRALQSRKLNNLSCLAIDLQFSPRAEDLKITDVELMFGSTLENHE